MPEKKKDITMDYRIEAGAYVEPPTAEAISYQKERQLKAIQHIRRAILNADHQGDVLDEVHDA